MEYQPTPWPPRACFGQYIHSNRQVAAGWVVHALGENFAIGVAKRTIEGAHKGFALMRSEVRVGCITTNVYERATSCVGTTAQPDRLG